MITNKYGLRKCLLIFHFTPHFIILSLEIIQSLSAASKMALTGLVFCPRLLCPFLFDLVASVFVKSSVNFINLVLYRFFGSPSVCLRLLFVGCRAR